MHTLTIFFLHLILVNRAIFKAINQTKVTTQNSQHNTSPEEVFRTSCKVPKKAINCSYVFNPTHSF